MTNKKQDQDTLSNVITSGLLLAVGVITLSLLSIGVINKTAGDSFETASTAVVFSPDAKDVTTAVSGETPDGLLSVQGIEPAAGDETIEGAIELFEENEEFYFDIETIDGLPPQPAE